MKCRPVRLWVRQICFVREIIVLSFCATKKKDCSDIFFQYNMKQDWKTNCTFQALFFSLLGSGHEAEAGLLLLPRHTDLIITSGCCLLRTAARWPFCDSTHVKQMENKFLKLLNSLSRNKDEWTIQLARCWLAQWDQYGPDGWRTDKSCLGRTSVSVWSVYDDTFV